MVGAIGVSEAEEVEGGHAVVGPITYDTFPYGFFVGTVTKVFIGGGIHALASGVKPISTVFAGDTFLFPRDWIIAGAAWIPGFAWKRV